MSNPIKTFILFTLLAQFGSISSRTVAQPSSSASLTSTDPQHRSFYIADLDSKTTTEALMYLTPAELSARINGNNENMQSVDYNISKDLYYADAKASNFREVWKRFQPDNHVQKNSAFSIAVMNFVSRYLGYELSHWLEYIAIMDERISQFMGLGLMDSQIIGGFSTADQRHILHRILSLAGNSDAFSRRKSICQRVLMFHANLPQYIEKYPSLITCATITEISSYFRGTQSNVRLQKINEQVKDLSMTQKDVLVRNLNEPHNFHVAWRNGDLNLASFDFMETIEGYLGMKRTQWVLSSTVTKLPTMAKWYKTTDEVVWSMHLLNLYDEPQIVKLLEEYESKSIQEGHAWSSVREIMRKINNELCQEFTLYQRFVIGRALDQTLNNKILDVTGWSKLEMKEFACFLDISVPEISSIEAPTSANDQKFTGNLRTSKIDGLFESLFYNSSQITSRKEAIEIVTLIRHLFESYYGYSFESIAQLEKHHFNTLTGFVLREFHSSEFKYTTKHKTYHEACRETFIRIGSIDSSDLSARKRQKLVEKFISQCQGSFEDNLRVLNSLVCDWKFEPQEIRSWKARQAWISRARDCEITDQNFAAKIWQEVSFMNQSLNELLYTLAPSNLCQVVPLTFWNSSSLRITNLEYDRLVWSLVKIDEDSRMIQSSENDECLRAIVGKLRDEMEKWDSWVHVILNDLTDKGRRDSLVRTMPCHDLIILRELNKYLEPDWLVNYDERARCVNRIGSNTSWFTHEQLTLYTNMLQSTRRSVFTINNAFEGNKINNAFEGNKLLWKFSNLFPYLNNTNAQTVLNQIGQNSEDRRQALNFLSQLSWPSKPLHTSNARMVLQTFAQELNYVHQKDIDIDRASNIICSLPFSFLRSPDKIRQIKSHYYCTETGNLKISPVIIPTTIRPYKNDYTEVEMLMDTSNIFIQEASDLTQIPMEIFKDNVDKIVNFDLFSRCSLSQLQYISENLPNTTEPEVEKKLWQMIDSGEVIEIRVESPSNEDKKLIPDQNNSADTEITETKENLGSYIVYITLSSTKLYTTFHLLLVCFTLKSLFL